MAVALWLETHGQAGLYARLEQLALAYQGERPDLEADDLTTLVVKGLVGLCQLQARRAIGPQPLETFHIRMAELVPVVQGLAEHYALADRAITAHRLGFILAKLCVSHARRLTASQGRHWLVTRADLERWKVSYGLRADGRGGQ